MVSLKRMETPPQPPTIFRRRLFPFYAGLSLFFFGFIEAIAGLVWADHFELRFLVPAVLSVLIGSALLFYWGRDRHLFAAISTEGIRSSTGFLRWSEVDEVWRESTGMWAVYNRARAYTLVRRQDGDQFEFNDHLRHFNKLETLILQHATHYLLPRALDAFQAGETLRFGKFTLNRLGIGWGQELLEWERVYGAFLVSSPGAVIQIYRKKTFDLWFEARLRHIPNAFIFLALIGYQLGSDPSGPVLYEAPGLPKPTPLSTPPIPVELGKHSATYRRRTRGLYSLLGVFLTRIAIFPLILLTLLLSGAEARPVVLTIVIIFAPVWLFLGAISPVQIQRTLALFWKTYQERHLRVELFNDGLRYFTRQDTAHTLRWTDIKHLWYSPLVYLNGIIYRTVLETHNGVVVELDMRLENLRELSEKVLRAVTQAQTLPAIHTIEKGGDIMCGKFGLNAQGLFDGETFHKWKDVQGATIDRKDPLKCRLWLRNKTNVLNWEALQSTPNLYLLLALTQHFS